MEKKSLEMYEEQKLFPFRISVAGSWSREDRYGLVNALGKVILPAKYEEINDESDGLTTASTPKGDIKLIDLKSAKGVIPGNFDATWDFFEGLAKVKVGGKYGHINRKGEFVVPCEYENASNFTGNIAFVKKDGKWGIVNRQGELITPCVYDSVGSFHSELAEVEKDGYFGFVNKEGKLIVKIQYEQVGGVNGRKRVRQDKKWGVIDDNGNLIVPCRHGWIDGITDSYIVAKKNGLCGIETYDGKEVLSYEYDKIEINNEGQKFAGWATLEANGKYGIKNLEGEGFVSCICDYLPGEFVEELSKICVDGKYGYVNLKGEIVIACQYDDANDFKNGKGIVCKDGKVHVFNPKGELLQTLEYDEMCYDDDETYEVVLNKLRGLLDKDFNVILPCEYDRVNTYDDYISAEKDSKCYVFSKTGKQVVALYKTDYKAPSGSAIICRNDEDKYGILDLEGNTIIPFEYQALDYESEGLFRVRKDGKWGYVNSKNEMVIAPQFDYAGNFSKGMALVKIGELYGFINTSAELVIPCKYTKVCPLDSDMSGRTCAPYPDGLWTYGYAQVKGENDGWGLVDQSGKEIIPCEYEEIICNLVPHTFYHDEYVNFDKLGFLLARNKTKYTPYDKDGNILGSKKKGKL